MNKILQNVLIGVATAACIGAGSFAFAALQSDPPPWAGVRNMQSMFLQLDIKDSMRNYCEAEWKKNTAAARAANEDIMEYELRYAALNNGVQIPLRPCP